MDTVVGLYAYRRILASERACRQRIRHIRWPRGVRCPRCQFARAYHYVERGVPQHRCKRCRYKFTDLTGTLFQHTKLPLSKWILAIALFKIGISANQLAKELGVAYRIAWKLLHLFRSSLRHDPLLMQLSGIVELDETYYGGRQHRNRRIGATGFTNKTPVLGMRSRDGRVKTIVVPHLRSRTLKRLLQQHVAPGSTIYTDDHKLHQRFRQWGYRHRAINKLFGYWQPPDVHTNAIEGYWMLSKTKLYARHHQMSPKYLPNYVAEMEYKFNHRHELDFVATMLKRLILGLTSE
jgi:transposase-like protein